MRAGRAFRQEKPLGGAPCAIDAIGFQARSKQDFSREDPSWVIEAMAELLNTAGRLAIIGVWPPKDPNAVEPSLKEGKLTVPWSKLFNKNTRIMMGRDDDKRWNRKLRDMIIAGAAKPNRICQVTGYRWPKHRPPSRNSTPGRMAISRYSQTILNLSAVAFLSFIWRESVTSLIVACGFSSMIQWPELGTIPTVTLPATKRRSSAMAVPKDFSVPIASTGIATLPPFARNSLLSMAS